jgi:DNA repair protein RecO (recombination protein O)
VIRLVDFSETSRVVTVFTREIGKLGALAKGARRLKGPFTGALDLLSVCRIVLIRKHSDGLDLLTDAELVKGFSPQRNNLQVLYAGCYVAELLIELLQEQDPHPALFDVAVETLRALEIGEKIRLILRHFELGILSETGHMPQLEVCVDCGQALTASGPYGFSFNAGGVLCGQCASKNRGSMRLQRGSVKVLHLLSGRQGSQWRRLQLSGAVDREVAAVTRGSILRLVGRELRTAQYLGDSLP